MFKPQVVLASPDKVILLDLLIPLLMQFRERYDNIGITVIVYSNESYDYLQKNYHIVEAMRIAKVRIIIARTGRKVMDIIRMARFLLGCIGRTTVLLKARDNLPMHKRTVAIIKIFGRVLECRALSQITVPSAKKGRASYGDLILDRVPKKQARCDVLLSSEQKGCNAKTVYMGYLKKLPAWSRFVKSSYDKFKDTVDSDYYFFALSSTKDFRLKWLREPDRFDLLCETLEALSVFSDRLYAVLKPHPVSDIDALHKAILKTGFTNYSISYAHPSVISMGAKFFISNCFSIACTDAWRMGKPVIDYYRYDSRLENMCGGWSPGGELVDHYVKTPAGLVDTVDTILYHDKPYKRSGLYFQEPTDWRYWDAILDKNKRTV